MAGADAPEPQDGRERRSARTRARLVEAVRTAVARGQDPTPKRVAKLAGVTERTLFRLFGSLPALWDAVRVRMSDDIIALMEVGPFEGDLQARTRELVRRRILVFEAIAPYRRWVDAREVLYPDIRAGRAVLDARLRVQTEQALATELAEAGPLGPVIDSVLSYETWNYLRTARGVGPRKVARLLEEAVVRLVTAPRPARGSR